MDLSREWKLILTLFAIFDTVAMWKQDTVLFNTLCAASILVWLAVVIWPIVRLWAAAAAAEESGRRQKHTK